MKNLKTLLEQPTSSIHSSTEASSGRNFGGDQIATVESAPS